MPNETEYEYEVTYGTCTGGRVLRGLDNLLLANWKYTHPRIPPLGTCIDVTADRLEGSMEGSYEEAITRWMGLWTPNTNLTFAGETWVRIVPPDSPFDWRKHPVSGLGELDTPQEVPNATVPR